MKRVIFVCLLVLWTATFTILTLQDGVTTAAVGEGFSKWIVDLFGLNTVIKTFVHMN